MLSCVIAYKWTSPCSLLWPIIWIIPLQLHSYNIILQPLSAFPLSFFLGGFHFCMFRGFHICLITELLFTFYLCNSISPFGLLPPFILSWRSTSYNYCLWQIQISMLPNFFLLCCSLCHFVNDFWFVPFPRICPPHPLVYLHQCLFFHVLDVGVCSVTHFAWWFLIPAALFPFTSVCPLPTPNQFLVFPPFVLLWFVYCKQ